MPKSLSEEETAKQLLSNREWRLNNIYYIVDKNGNKNLFKLNAIQSNLYKNLHYFNVVLKARQMGITTFVTLLFLDTALFNSNVSCGIVADTEENAKYIFRKIKFAYDCLPEALKEIRAAQIDSAKELTFANNSLIRVGTSLRSATFQYLLISEFGKIAAEDYKRSNEILSGTLNTIGAGSYCFLESTARGRGGAFYDLCDQAKKLKEQGKPLTKMDFSFHFFPWYSNPEYQLAESVHIPEDLVKYFKELQETHSIVITPPQMAWYASKYKTQGDNMKREFPSTPEEAFEASNEGLYYGKQMSEARQQRRVRKVYYDANVPVHTAWDLGYNDSTAIWLFQQCGQEIHLLECYENSGEPLTHYLQYLKSKPFTFGKHLVPHDAAIHEFSTGLSRVEVARNHGVNFTVVPDIGVNEGIDAVRNLLNRCWFDEEKCSKGIHSLENYKREWNERQGCWASQPLHNFASHGADAFRMLAVGMGQLGNKGLTAEGWRQLREKYVS